MMNSNFFIKLLMVLAASSAVGFAAYLIIISSAPAPVPMPAAPEQAKTDSSAQAADETPPKPRVIFKAKPKHTEPGSYVDDSAVRQYAENTPENASALKLKEGYKIPADAETSRFVIPEKEVEANKSIEDIYEKMRDSDSEFTTDETGKPIILVTKVDENGIVHKIGFRSGDKVRAINGYSVSNMIDAVSLYTKLKDEKQFSVELERNGKKMVFFYRVGR